MQTVTLGVHHVVEEIDRSAQAAEDHEGGERRPGERREHLLGEDDAGEDEEVLHPLARAERGEESQSRAHAAAPYNRITCGWVPSGPVRLRMSSTSRASRTSRAASNSR